MSPQNQRDPRQQAADSDVQRSGTDRLPPYSGPGQEPGEQVAGAWISPADHSGERADSDITTDDIVPPIAHSGMHPGHTGQNPDIGTPVQAAYPQAARPDRDAKRDDRRMTTFTEKEGGAPLPASIQRDPVSAGVGPFSRAIVAIAVVVLLLILVAVIVSLV